MVERGKPAAEKAAGGLRRGGTGSDRRAPQQAQEMTDGQ
jgi:hypothetical protein